MNHALGNHLFEGWSIKTRPSVFPSQVPRAVIQADFDRAAAEYKTAAAKTGETRATIGRKTIRAPFSGVLGIRQVNLGQYLNSGQPIVPLQALDPIHVDFSVPQQALSGLAEGRPVKVAAEGVPGELAGTVTAVDSVGDAATRNVRVEATFANPEARLRPGMFVETRVEEGSGEAVVSVPASAISYAPYGDSVFVIESATNTASPGLVVRQQFIRTGRTRGDFVSVTSGLKAGQRVASAGLFKLRNGMSVVENNEIAPKLSETPRPPER